MKDSQDHERLVSGPEINSERKAPQYGAPYVAEDKRVAFGMDGCPLDRLSDLIQELLAEPTSTVFVPSGRLFKLIPCGAPEDYA